MASKMVNRYFCCQYPDGTTSKVFFCVLLQNWRGANRLVNKNMFIGIDAMDYVYEMPNRYKDLFLKEKSFKNWFDKEYATLQIYGGKMKLHVTMPMIDREDNVLPFSIQDLAHIKQTKNDLLYDLEKVFKENKIDFDPRLLILRSLECGITIKVEKGATPSDVLSIIDISIDDETNISFHRSSKKKRYDQEKETVYAPFKYKNIDFKAKSYNKSLEQRKKGNFGVEDGLLRIELIFMKQAVSMIFGDVITLDEVLEKRNLLKVINEYKVLFRDIVVGKYISSFTEYAIRTMSETLKSASLMECIAKHSNLILDRELVREAMISNYIDEGCSHTRAIRNADKRICDLKDKDIVFPQNALKTIEKFEKMCE